MYYYDVSLGLEGTWAKTTFTYEHHTKLELGNIVVVPFGRKKLTGIIVGVVDAAVKNIKPIESILEIKLPVKNIRLLDWLRSYYPYTGGNIAQSLVLPTYIKNIKEDVAPKKEFKTTSPKPIELSDDQKRVKQKIVHEKRVIVHGVTGAGKTRIYASIGHDTLSSGKSVLILQPEIGLTSSVTTELLKYFDATQLVITHSKMTQKERMVTWQKVATSKEPLVIIGPRSAMFLPFTQLGLVVMDEFHDQSYKQDDGIRYDSIFVASQLAKIHDSILIFGSATPSVAHTKMMLDKNIPLVCLHNRAGDSQSKKNITIVDSKDRKEFTRSETLSNKLINQISDSLDKGKQSLIYLNRRGSAKVTLCNNCGSKVECPRCDSSLVYHHDSYKNICHICGYTESPRTYCNTCKSPDLISRSFGTKYLEHELSKLFPKARIKRFDTDNKKHESLHSVYDQVRDGEFDILIGTQILTKGIDLPLLDTVGIVQAETSLYIPDYSSEERTFQQINQVVGRVGRVHADGTVILQTYQPDNALLTMAVDEHWHDFYDQELKRRQVLQFPPYTYSLVIGISKKTREASQKALLALLKEVDTENIRVLGPAPSFYEKKQVGTFSWQVILLAKNRSLLMTIVKNLPKGFTANLDPQSFL